MATFTGINALGIFPARHKSLITTPMPDLVTRGEIGNALLPGGHWGSNLGGTVPLGPAASTLTGHIAGSFADIFYNRIYVVPVEADIGQLFSPYQIDVVIWNGYLNQAKDFESIDITGGDGIALVQGEYDLPSVSMGPLTEIRYTLMVGLDGPAKIDCSILWNFTGTEDDKITVLTGSRSVLWPFTFLRDLTETLAWLTDVIKPDNGAEQRISLRNAPRQVFEIQSRIPKDKITHIGNLLFGWRHRTWAFPVRTESARLSSPISIDDTRIMFDTRFADYRVGGNCVVYHDPDKYFIGTISFIADTYLDVTEDIPDQYLLTDQCMPIRSAVLLADPAIKSKAGNNPVASARFGVVDNCSLAGVDPDNIYKGLDVMGKKPTLSGNSSEVQDLFEREMAIYDFEVGIRKQLSTWDYTRKGRGYTLILRNREAIWNFRLWLHKRQGKAVPFYQPTFQADFLMTDLDGIIGNVLICQNNYHPTMGFDRVHLAFFLTDGTLLFNTITGSGANTDGTMTLTLEDTLDTQRSEVTKISYMGVKRLAADSVKINWIRTDLAEIDYSIVEIRP